MHSILGYQVCSISAQKSIFVIECLLFCVFTMNSNNDLNVHSLISNVVHQIIHHFLNHNHDTMMLFHISSLKLTGWLAVAFLSKFNLEIKISSIKTSLGSHHVLGPELVKGKPAKMKLLTCRILRSSNIREQQGGRVPPQKLHAWFLLQVNSAIKCM